MPNSDSINTINHQPLINKLLMLVVAAIIFAIALVPLYDALCQATGFNGRTFLVGASSNKSDIGSSTKFVPGGLIANDSAALSEGKLDRITVDATRNIAIDFTSTIMPGLPWEIRPLTPNIEVHPGEVQMVKFLVRNTSNEAITGQAIPSVSPGQAGKFFHKIECFCFNQQKLAPGESREMPVIFVVKPDIDQNISNITLAYSFFIVENQQNKPNKS